MRTTIFQTVPFILLGSAILASQSPDPVTPAPTTLADVFLPGSQPGQSGQLETPDKCDNCHGGYNVAVEPAFNWRGSMMSQAARDPLFYAALAIANQDAPDSGDLCLRCHTPAGWLEGRSTPTDGSLLNANDREGVQCDFCHKLVRPSAPGSNPYPGDQTYVTGTYPEDQNYLSVLTNRPGHTANGMYVADDGNAKRGPFADTAARHQTLYSPFHSDAAICGTCHDVSNPVFSWNAALGAYVPNTFGEPAPDFDPRTMFPVERTFTEWSLSEFARTGVEIPGVGGNKTIVSTCQDCHMRDVTGYAANKSGTPLRQNLPLHDLTGGNTFVPGLVAAIWPSEVSVAALDAGVQRATEMLHRAALLDLTVSPSATGYQALVRVTNQTGHKLPSGYPEGRRIWVNIQARNAEGDIVFESGHYDPAIGTLDRSGAKVYEAELAAGGVKGFHFVLNSEVVKDNRIPPRGFTNAAFAAAQAAPVGYSYTDGQYWDDTTYQVPETAIVFTATLYYQAVSDEYITFLRDENRTNHWGQTLYDLWTAHGRGAPVAMASATVFAPGASDTEPPTAPAGLTATAVSRSQVQLSWTAATDAFGVTAYRVYRGGILVASPTATGYSDSGLEPSTAYVYTVTAIDAAANESLPSNEASATTEARKGRK